MPGWLSSVRNAGARSELASPADAWLAAQVVAFAAAVPLLMRVPLPRLMPRITPRAPRAVDHRSAFKATVFALAFMRRFGRATANPCLHRSLTLYHFLRRFGVPVELHFGFDPRSDLGHAWVSHRGEPLYEGEDPAERYREMLRFPTHDAAPAARGAGA